MARKKLEIGSCQWLKENENTPGVAKVWRKKIEECKEKEREREAPRLNKRIGDPLEEIKLNKPDTEPKKRIF